MIGFNQDLFLGFVLDVDDDEADDDDVDADEEELEDCEGREMPLGSTTFAACFDARTL